MPAATHTAAFHISMLETDLVPLRKEIKNIYGIGFIHAYIIHNKEAEASEM